MALRRVVLAVVVLVSAAHAAPSDCIRDSPTGEMDCIEPSLISENVSICYEGPNFNPYNSMLTACGSSPIARGDTGTIISRINCFHDMLTGCPGTSAAQWPGWSTAGMVRPSSDCNSQVTRYQNNYLMNEWAFIPGTGAAMGNCNLTGQPFSPPMTVFVNRVLQCGPGWAQSQYANGDIRCSKCPPNSTPSAGGCVCVAGYVKDPRSRRCIPRQCTYPTDCPNYPNFCGGRAVCNNGICEPGQIPNCNDGQSCTADSCSASLNQCVHDLDPNRCVCDATGLGMITSQVTLSIPVIPELPCPALKGAKLGATVMASAALSGQDPRCDNGCKGVIAGELGLSAEVKACAKGRSVSAKGKFSQTDESCFTCDRNTCRQGCSAEGGCRDRRGGGTLATTGDLYRFFATPSLPWIEVKCAAKGSAGADVTIAYEGTSPLPGDGGTACPTCRDCSTLSTTVTATGGASGSCEVGAPAPPKPLPQRDTRAVVKGSAELTLGGGFVVTGRTCPSETCLAGTLSVTGKAKIAGSVSYKYYSVGVECSAELTGCSETQTCGTCTCGGAACSDIKEKTSCRSTQVARQP